MNLFYLLGACRRHKSAFLGTLFNSLWHKTQISLAQTVHLRLCLCMGEICTCWICFFLLHVALYAKQQLTGRWHVWTWPDVWSTPRATSVTSHLLRLLAIVMDLVLCGLNFQVRARIVHLVPHCQKDFSLDPAGLGKSPRKKTVMGDLGSHYEVQALCNSRSITK